MSSERKIYAISILFFFICIHLFAQNEAPKKDLLIRYVATVTDGGAYSNDGLSWDAPKNKVQLAINDLRRYMVEEGITTGGKVFVKEGIYTPTESTDQNSVNVLNTSFLIYEGITVYGGFAKEAKGYSLETDEKVRPREPITSDKYHYEWEFQRKTVLSGSHSGGIDFKWNAETQQYDAVYSGNSYHVVWFATNGFHEKTTDGGKRLIHRANGLTYEAGVDGCVIEGGNASYRDMVKHYHAAYGGGAYLVKNSFLRNCEITLNTATRRGGAVYMDGGGLLKNCYVHRNQCPGLGGVEGYGGGVAIDLDGQVAHSAIVNNYARIGGGLALSYDDDNPVASDVLLPSAMSTLIANNTAAQEAGGLFFNHGGSVNHLTVVRNRCNGTDVTIKGIRFGRSGGAYALECGSIYNSVFWGGKVENNRDVQMAQHSNSSQNNNVRMNYTAIENHDISDWTGVVKVNVLGLERENVNSGNSDDLYPHFKNVSSEAGVLAEAAPLNEGKNHVNVIDYFAKGIDWQPMSSSALREKSVQIIDLHNQEERETFEHINNKLPLNKRQLGTSELLTFEPRDVVGAYFAQEVQVKAAVAGQQLTVFVDPSHATLTLEKDGSAGASWDNPLNNLNMALDFFRGKTWNTGDVWKIVVKEGTLTTVGKYYNRHMRSSYIDMADHVTIEGGYAKSLTGTDLTSIRRNPMEHRTVISGNIADDAYENNVCHIVTFYNVSDAVIDGVCIDQANAVSDKLFDSDPIFQGQKQFQHGGGIICWNTFLGKEPATPIDMVGNVLRNCVISNCSAHSGSAVYLHAEKGTKVSLKMENCIIHNNTSAKGVKDPHELSTLYVGVDTYSQQNVLAGGPGTATLELNHCDIIKNVGHPVITEKRDAADVATVKLLNTMVWANATEFLNSSTDLAAAPDKVLHLGMLTDANLGTTIADGSTNCVLDQGQDVPAKLLNSKAVLSYKSKGKDQVDTSYPDFVNPTIPIGVGEYGDVTVYGGAPDFTPKSMNPVVNEANSSGTTDLVGNDRTSGGLPDVGALENKKLLPYGAVVYVRPSGDDSNDGLSWSSAVKTLSKALSMVSENSKQQIWVAQGVYRPTQLIEYESKTQEQNEQGYLIFNSSKGYKVYSDSKGRYYIQDGVKPGYQPYEGDTQSFKPVYAQLEENGYLIFTTNKTDMTNTADYIYQQTVGDVIHYYKKDGNNYVELKPIPHAGDLKPSMEQKKEGKYWVFTTTPDTPNDSKNWVYQDNTQTHSYWKENGNYFEYKSAPKNAVNPEMDKKNNYLIYEKTGKGKGPTYIYYDEQNTTFYKKNKKDNYERLQANEFEPSVYRIKESNRPVEVNGYILLADVDNAFNVYYKKNNTYYWKDDTSGQYVPCKDVPTNLTEVPGTTQNKVYDKYEYEHTNGDLYYSDKQGVGPYYWYNAGTFVECQNPPTADQLKPVYSTEPQKTVDGHYWVYSDGKNLYYQKIDSGLFYESADVPNYKKYTPATDEQLTPIYVKGRTAYEMIEGVNVFGGFPAEGNPSFRERDPKAFETKLEAGDVNYTTKDNAFFNQLNQASVGRVLTQFKDFTTTTTWDGMSFTNGFLHSVYRQNLSGKINAIRDNINTAAEMGAAGVYLRTNGVLENCEIKDNLTFVFPQKGSTLHVNNSGGGCHAVAGGVYNNGGTLKNCVISHNQMVHRFAGVSSWMYGVGLFQSNGTVYNTIIADNLGKVVQSGSLKPAKNFTVAGAGAFLQSGDFYNNTIVDNRSETIENATQSTHIVVPGIYVFDNITMYNCIVANNTHNLDPAWITAKQSETPVIYGYPVLATTDPTGSSDIPRNPEPNPAGVKAFHCCVMSEEDPLNPGKLLPDKNLIATEPQFNNLTNDKNPKLDDGVKEPKNKYHLLSGSPCINTGTDDISRINPDTQKPEPIIIPDVDADYNDRVQDCRIDMGAFEYNGAYDITPTIVDEETDPEGNVTHPHQFRYYVTENGDGVNSGADIQNAACAEKLQLVLDAAGRLRHQLNCTPEADLPAEYQGKSDYEIVVRLSGNSKDKQGNMTQFAYTPQRSVNGKDLENENPRSWSLMVPNGVTLQGGWTANFEKDAQEPFPDVTAHPTIISGIYQSEDQKVQVYHTITFTQNVFDPQEHIVEGQKLVDSSDEALSKVKAKIPRAVLCGLFVKDGMADGELESEDYGGGAIVTDYAHVRNCVFENNQAYEGGGALMLKPKALVSGSLFKNNEAKEGGAIFVESLRGNSQDGTVPPTVVVKEDSTTRARIYTSTIVDNRATKSGGGIFFTDNMRANSCVFWNNHSSSQADVAGVYEKNDVDTQFQEEAYSFAYSAVENLRLPGLNNRSVSASNELGVRFATEEKGGTQIEPYYALTDYSILLRTGMPINEYKKLVAEKNLAPRDFYRTARFIDGLKFDDRTDDPLIEQNKYIDVGARSLGKRTIYIPEAGHVLRRIYVAHPDRVDMQAVRKVQEFRTVFQSTNPDAPLPLNAELGGSFSYPMQSMDDALRYIVTARKDASIPFTDKAFFEIFVSGGTFYPETSPVSTKQGQDKAEGTPMPGTSWDNYSRSKTFLVPEGVAIMGGINPLEKGDDGVPNVQLCQDSTKEAQPLEIGQTIYAPMTAKDTEVILHERKWFDLNSNDIYEPWEMKEQTIFSGKNINQEGVSEVYHVVMVSADPNYVGYMGQGKNKYTPKGESQEKDIKPGVVRFDGIQISDGKAWHDPDEDVTDSPLYLMDYVGGGIYASGVEHMGKNSDGSLNVSYRPIPLKLSHCRFIGNRAGWGGALLVNLPCNIASCAFERNEAIAREDDLVVKYTNGSHVKGMGSAIFTANMTLITNSLFANNEARSNGLVPQKPSAGGNSLPQAYGAGTIAVFAMNTNKTKENVHGKVSMLNCNIVNNRAQRYPAIFAFRPNSADDNKTEVVPGVSGKNNHAIMNSIFWGNEAEEAKTDARYNHVINFSNGDLSKPFDGNLDNAYEALWFCAYQEGRARKPIETKTDFRSKEIAYTTYLPEFFRDPDTKVVCNNNLYLSNDNFALNGPNFTNPSLGAGVDYFLPTANWQPYRQNHLTDNGWTFLQQTIKKNETTTPVSYDCTFNKDSEDKYIGGGAYYTFYYQIHDEAYGSIGVPFGNETYMKNKKEKPMHRVSFDPNPSHDQSYIDIGLYEYQHVRLEYEEGQPEDVLWVGETEKGDANGKTWNDATSNLQRAIETLLASRNGHRKAIHLIQGSYTPTYVLGGNLGFRIDTKSLDKAAIVDKNQKQEEQTVKSLRFLGGWNVGIADKREVGQNTTKIVMTQIKSSDHDRMRHLFDIADAQQRIGLGQTEGAAETDGTVIPILFDGITFVNPYGDDKVGGAAIRYADQMQTNGKACLPPTDTVKTKFGDARKAKLSVTRCEFRLNGIERSVTPDITSVIKVGKGGGRSLFYDALFHSNSGATIQAIDTTNIVHCTFALNGGNLQLGDASSKIYGSAFWRNNLDLNYKSASEFQLPGGGLPESTLALFHHNAISRPDGKLGTFTTSKDGGVKWSNCVLSDDNNDIIYGPNFNQPLPDAGKADYVNRSFQLSPSTTMLNQGEATDWSSIDGTLPDIDVATDIAGRPRLQANRIDIGAYEYQQPLQRIVYVDLASLFDSGSGDSWDKAFSKGDLQMAIDVAAVYAANKQLDVSESQAFVYVKSPSTPSAIEETLILRDGVSVYGGIDPSETDMAKKTQDEHGFHYVNQDVLDFEQRICHNRPGIASALSHKSTIAGVTTSGKYERLTVFDGFEFTPAKGYENARAVFLKSEENGVNTGTFAPIVVRNSIFHGYQAKDAPVIEVQNGLLYNCLVRDNTADQKLSVLDIAGNGWAINNTFVSTLGTDLIPAVQSFDTWRFNLLGKSSMSTFAPYFRPGNGAPEHHTQQPDLWYQLAEQSPDIDKTKYERLSDDSSVPAFLSNPLNGFIDMDNDLDLLANPRRLGRFVDYGCFETWSARQQKLQVNTHVNSYGGAHYPHLSSVVYTGTNAIEVDVDNFDLQKVPAIRPGYFLLQKGGGWYGHGAANLELSYAAVECELEDHNLLSLPFEFDYRNKSCYSVNYESQNEEQILKLEPFSPVEVDAYDSKKRAESHYLFAVNKSGCWKDVTEKMPANVGVYYHMNAGEGGATYRFTSWNEKGQTTPIYKEGTTAKEVLLQQANATELDAEGKPNFTAMENMGWNLVGQPYMVSHYLTSPEEGRMGMNVPHVIYKLKNTGDYESWQSWAPSTTVSVGEAFFTQTAVVKNEKESLTFDFPSPAQQLGRAKENRVVLRSAAGEDDIVVCPSVECTDMSYDFGSDGLMWMSENERLPQLYLANEQGTRFSLVAAAPVEKELPLGIRAVVPGEHTFALPSHDAFAEFDHVWLTDREEGVVTDLKVEGYTVALTQALDSPERFTLKFGGASPLLKQTGDEAYEVFIRHGMLHVKGLMGGEHISVCDIVGRPILSEVGTQRNFITPLPTGVYIVKVNGNVYKVR